MRALVGPRETPGIVAALFPPPLRSVATADSVSAPTIWSFRGHVSGIDDPAGNASDDPNFAAGFHGSVTDSSCPIRWQAEADITPVNAIRA